MGATLTSQMTSACPVQVSVGPRPSLEWKEARQRYTNCELHVEETRWDEEQKEQNEIKMQIIQTFHQLSLPPL